MNRNRRGHVNHFLSHAPTGRKTGVEQLPTFFALSADVVGERKIKAAEYYLAYYAMLHAMWAVIYLHPDQSTEHVTSITHSKMSNLYHAEFASGNGRIIVEDVKALAEDLRFLREYYSYRMPLNSPFEAHSELSLSYARLGGFVKHSIQLANLHSNIIRKVAEKSRKAGALIAPNEIVKSGNVFSEINAKKHQSRDYEILDDPDSRARTEFLVHGCDLVPLSIGYDHMFDNFMTWDHERPDEGLLQRVRALVGRALF